jgi:hypothetical protein
MGAALDQARPAMRTSQAAPVPFPGPPPGTIHPIPGYRGGFVLVAKPGSFMVEPYRPLPEELTPLAGIPGGFLLRTPWAPPPVVASCAVEFSDKDDPAALDAIVSLLARG